MRVPLESGKIQGQAEFRGDRDPVGDLKQLVAGLPVSIGEYDAL
jgi:hypothetical protein